jgi:hypothetical protein
MRLKLSLALTLALCGPPIFADRGTTRAQDARQDAQGDQKVIDEFITTRGVSFAAPSGSRPAAQTSRPAGASSGRKSGGPVAKNSGGARPGGGGAKKGGGPSEVAGKSQPAGKGAEAGPPPAGASAAGETAAVTDAGDGQANVIKTSAASGPKRPIGLGFTLFMKQGGNLIATDASREFRAGDQFRIFLESNTDGYLYVFHTEDGRNPQMLLPNAAVDGGANAVGAHTRDFYPTDLSAWIEFDQNPATEKLYIVVSRAPLPGVPTGQALVSFCGGPKVECSWKPTAAQWERIKAGAGAGRVVEGRNTQLAKLEAPPAAAMTRGLKVKKEEPAPAVVRVNSSAEADVFVTTIDLIHK